jgi:hypothetical protein
LKQCAETRTTQLASKFRSSYGKSHTSCLTCKGQPDAILPSAFSRRM